MNNNDNDMLPPPSHPPPLMRSNAYIPEETENEREDARIMRDSQTRNIDNIMSDIRMNANNQRNPDNVRYDLENGHGGKKSRKSRKLRKSRKSKSRKSKSRKLRKLRKKYRVSKKYKK